MSQKLSRLQYSAFKSYFVAADSTDAAYQEQVDQQVDYQQYGQNGQFYDPYSQQHHDEQNQQHYNQEEFSQQPPLQQQLGINEQAQQQSHETQVGDTLLSIKMLMSLRHQKEAEWDSLVLWFAR